MKAYYPKSTNKIMHKGRQGNPYRLDGIEKCIQVSKHFKNSTTLDVIEVSTNSVILEKEAIALVSSVHTPEILSAYKTGTPESLANSSGIMWQSDTYVYALENALAAKLATEEALRTGFALAIEGGGHHAEKNHPFGFCLINTMAIAAQVGIEMNKKVAIVDLDTHYSNGCFDILKGNPNITVYSLWNQKLDKWKETKADNLWYEKVETVDDYLEKLNSLVTALTRFKPDLVIYHLGLDIMDSDRMGGVVGLKDSDTTKRDLMIKAFLSKNNTPIVVFLGGAYVDWSKGVEFAKERRKYLTDLFCKEIELLIPQS